jgi:hypothetical protein
MNPLISVSLFHRSLLAIPTSRLMHLESIQYQYCTVMKLNRYQTMNITYIMPFLVVRYHFHNI